MARLGRTFPIKPLTLPRRFFTNVLFYDNNFGQQTGPATTNSFSYIVTTNNPYLLAYAETDGGDNMTSVTYGGVSMTQLGKVVRSDGRYSYIYALMAPPTGTNTMTGTRSTSGTMYLYALSYGGAAQSGQPDSFNSAAPNTAASPYSLSTTVVAPNSWVMAIYDNLSGSVTNVGGSVNTLRTPGFFYDSNGIVATGSQNISITFTGTFSGAVFILSVKPFTGVTVSTVAAFLLRMISPF